MSFRLTKLQHSSNVALHGKPTNAGRPRSGRETISAAARHAHSSPETGRPTEVAEEKKHPRRVPDNGDPLDDSGTVIPLPDASTRVKFEIFGEEMIEKRVKASGNSGRVYLPPDWVGHKVKIIRID